MFGIHFLNFLLVWYGRLKLMKKYDTKDIIGAEVNK